MNVEDIIKNDIYNFKNGEENMLKIQLMKQKLNFIVFIFGVALTIVLVLIITNYGIDVQEKRASQTVEKYGERIEALLNEYKNKTDILKAVIVSYDGQLDEDVFYDTASSLITDQGIRALQYLPDGIVEYCYPLEANEASLKDNILERPDRKTDAILSKKLDKIIVSGPLTLKQGGQALIIRNPIYLSTSQSQKEFLGFSQIVLDLPEALKSVGLDYLKEEGYLYQLAVVSSDGQKRVIEDQFQEDDIQHFVTRNIQLEETRWVLKIYPSGGWVNVYKAMLMICVGIILSFLLSRVVFHEIQKRELLKELQKDENLLKLAIKKAKIKIFLYNHKTKKLMFKSNEENNEIMNHIQESSLESIIQSYIYPESQDNFMRMYKALEKGETSVEEVIKVRKDQSSFAWIRITMMNLSPKDKNKENIIGIIENITDEKIAEESFVQEKRNLRYRAEFDQLTHIFNRATLQEKVENHLQHTSLKNVLLIIDLDNFKQINDKMGHNQGDIVLKDVASILKKVFRNTDIIGRLGGDEFVVFMKDINNHKIIEEKVKKVLRLVEREYRKDHNVIKLSCSIGIAVSPECGTSFEQLYDVADQALYHVKNNGKSGYDMMCNDKNTA